MISPGRELLLSSVTERDWQAQVVVWLHRAGFLVHHVHDSRSDEWSGDRGFPDLVAVGRGRVLFIELKTRLGRLREDQAIWGGALRVCAGVEYYVWRPIQENEIKATLGIVA